MLSRNWLAKTTSKLISWHCMKVNNQQGRNQSSETFHGFKRFHFFHSSFGASFFIGWFVYSRKCLHSLSGMDGKRKEILALKGRSWLLREADRAE